VLYPDHTLTLSSAAINKLTQEYSTVIEPFLLRLQSEGQELKTRATKNTKAEGGTTKQRFKEEFKRFYKVNISKLRAFPYTIAKLSKSK
jgi:hypothetical protein